MNIPADFEPLFRSSPFIDLIGPIYNKKVGQGLTLGFRAEDKHCNARGLVHGGVLSSLADIALGYNAVLSAGKPLSMVTTSLTIDFMSGIQVGDWVEVEAAVQKVGRRVAFANCYFMVEGQQVARASAVFSVSEK